MTQPLTNPGHERRRNLRVAVACSAVFFSMVGLAFASVPLYDLFCRVTGYGGTPQFASSADGIQVLDRDITVRFDSNVTPGLGLHFEPVQRHVTLKIGELGTVSYRAKNTSDQTIHATATFNVTPDATGAYFSKIACFCFTEQTFEPGQEIEMGVSFYVDPAIVDDPDSASVHTITLSYTFFKAREPEKPVAAVTDVAPPNRL